MKTYYFYYVLNLKIMEMEGPLRLPVASSRALDVFFSGVLPGREVYRPACIHNPEPERIVTHKFSYLLPFFLLLLRLCVHYLAAISLLRRQQRRHGSSCVSCWLTCFLIYFLTIWNRMHST